MVFKMTHWHARCHKHCILPLRAHISLISYISYYQMPSVSGHIAWPATNTTNQCTLLINDKHPSHIIEASKAQRVTRELPKCQAAHGITDGIASGTRQNTTQSMSSRTSMQAFKHNHPSHIYCSIQNGSLCTTAYKGKVPLASQKKAQHKASHRKLATNKIGRSYK